MSKMIEEISYPKHYLYRRIVQAKIFIDNNYQAALDAHLIADEACFSKYHFIRIFKQVYGLTPHQYLTKVRIAHAAELLFRGKSVAESCFTVGFESVGTFSGLFKKYMHRTPSGYQLYEKNRVHQMRSNPLQYVPGCFSQKHGWTKVSNFEEVAL